MTQKPLQESWEERVRAILEDYRPHGFSFAKVMKEHGKGDWDDDQVYFWFIDIIRTHLAAAEKRGYVAGVARCVEAMEAAPVPPGGCYCSEALRAIRDEINKK